MIKFKLNDNINNRIILNMNLSLIANRFNKYEDCINQENILIYNDVFKIHSFHLCINNITYCCEFYNGEFSIVMVIKETPVPYSVNLCSKQKWYIIPTKNINSIMMRHLTYESIYDIKTKEELFYHSYHLTTEKYVYKINNNFGSYRGLYQTYGIYPYFIGSLVPFENEKERGFWSNDKYFTIYYKPNGGLCRVYIE